MRIGILDEHPEWSKRLIGELEGRGLTVERIDHSSHGFDPRDRRPAYDALVNRSSWFAFSFTAPFSDIRAISLSATLSSTKTSFSPMQSRLLS